MTWIYSIPAGLFFIGVLLALSALAGAGLVVFQRVVPQSDELAHNDVAGPIIGTIGTILAVLLSFLLIGNWQEYDGAAATVAQEASAVADLYHTASFLPGPIASKIKAACRTYVNIVVDREWPAMRSGGRSPQAMDAALELLRTVAQYQPQTSNQQALQQSALGLVDQIMDTRRTRLFANDQGIPMIFWAGNFFIAAITIVFCYLFRVRKRGLHVAMTVGLMCAIATLFVITAELDYPFRGETQIQPGPFLQLQQTVNGDSLNQANRPR